VSDPRFGVTSLIDLGRPVAMPDVDIVLRREFEALFGASTTAREAATASVA
jgi:lipoyl(octanoyl) transferase